MTTVVGGINMDIGARSFAALRERDSNPGQISVRPGGVGFNIARNLALLGEQVTMLSAVGEDEYAPRIRRECRRYGVADDAVRIVPGERTSVYLYIAGPDGDMALAVNDMAVTERIDGDYLATQADRLQTADAVVVDANLTEETLRCLTEQVTAPVFADGVSAAKVRRLAPSLERLYALKVNEYEAQMLTGIEARDEEALRRMAESIADRGVRNVFLSLGGEGLLAFDGRSFTRLPAPEGAPRDTTGGGDAMTAGLVRAYRAGMTAAAGAAFALAAASLAVETEGTINDALCFERCLERARL